MHLKLGYAYPADWEHPDCDFCSSPPPRHRQILFDAKDSDHSLVECAECGLRFFSPRIKWSALARVGYGTDRYAKEEAERLFRNASFYEVANPEEQKKNIAEYYEGMLKECISFLDAPLQRIYEVGCAVGWFLLAAKNLGIPDLYGCENNIWSAAIARDQIGGGLNIRGIDFSDDEVPPGMDLVVALDFIEHSFRPWFHLQKLAGALRPGGMLLLKTFLDEVDANHAMLAPPCHSVHPTEAVLRKMFFECGVEPVVWRIDPVPIVLILGRKR